MCGLNIVVVGCLECFWKKEKKQDFLECNLPCVSVEATTEDKNDALFFDAVLKGNMTQAKWFFEKGANIRKPSGNTLLLFLCFVMCY